MAHEELHLNLRNLTVDDYEQLEQLMDAASVVLDDNTITSHIKRIRRKFNQLDPQFDGIQTVYGMGYRWHQPAAGD